MSKPLQRRLLLAREKLVMTQEQMAERMEVSVQTLTRWEHGTLTPSGATLEAVNIKLTAIFETD